MKLEDWLFAFVLVLIVANGVLAVLRMRLAKVTRRNELELARRQGMLDMLAELKRREGNR